MDRPTWRMVAIDTATLAVTYDGRVLFLQNTTIEYLLVNEYIHWRPDKTGKMTDAWLTDKAKLITGVGRDILL